MGTKYSGLKYTWYHMELESYQYGICSSFVHVPCQYRKKTLAILLYTSIVCSVGHDNHSAIIQLSNQAFPLPPSPPLLPHLPTLPPSLSECQHLKAQVIQYIRSNEQLKQDLQNMDVKIGLLIRNKISLKDVTPTSQRKRPKPVAAGQGAAASPGYLGGFSKASQEKLEVSHLYHQLHTNETGEVNPAYYLLSTVSWSRDTIWNGVTKARGNIICCSAQFWPSLLQSVEQVWLLLFLNAFEGKSKFVFCFVFF